MAHRIFDSLLEERLYKEFINWLEDGRLLALLFKKKRVAIPMILKRTVYKK